MEREIINTGETTGRNGATHPLDPALEPPSTGRRKPGARNRGITKDLAMVELVATLSFTDGAKSCWRGGGDVIKDLAALGHLGISAAAVSACQHEAFKHGMISIAHHLSAERPEVARLELAMLRRYRSHGLRHIMLVPGNPEMLKSAPEIQTEGREPRAVFRDIHTEVTGKLTEATATYLTKLLERVQHETPYRIGVAWGETLYRVARALRARGRGKRPKRITVLPIVGITDAEQLLPVEANQIASMMAKALGGVSGQLPCPAIVKREEYQGFARGEQVARQLGAVADCHAIVTGLGPIEYVETPDDIRITTDVARNRQLLEGAHGANACGEICFWCFDRRGQSVDPPHQSIGLGLPGLAHIAANPARDVIVVAGGDARRIIAIHAAMLGGYLSTLVTDTVTARVLLGEIATPWFSGKPPPVAKRGDPMRPSGRAR